MHNNIMVIGNGYDLAHGLKTKYDDFIGFVKKVNEEDGSLIIEEVDREFISDCIENNGFLNYFLSYVNIVPGWVDLERLLNEVTHYFELFFENYTHFIDSRGNILWNTIDNDMAKNPMMRIVNCLFMFRLFDKDNSRANIICKHLDKKYYTDIFGLNKREIINFLKDQLDELIRLFQLYLKKYINQNETAIKKISQIEDINPSYVISFNYNLIDVFGKKQALELIQTEWIQFVQCET